MNNETMVLGTGLLLLGLYNTYFVPSDSPIGYVNKIVLLSTGAIVVEHANNDETPYQTIESVAKNMVGIQGA